jgi:hypothetical protein
MKERRRLDEVTHLRVQQKEDEVELMIHVLRMLVTRRRQIRARRLELRRKERRIMLTTSRYPRTQSCSRHHDSK